MTLRKYFTMNTQIITVFAFLKGESWDKGMEKQEINDSILVAISNWFWDYFLTTHLDRFLRGFPLQNGHTEERKDLRSEELWFIAVVYPKCSQTEF